MTRPIPNSICDDCLNAECVWRAPSWGIDPPVMDCPDKKAPPVTHYDLLIRKTPEELAEWIRDQIIDRNIGIPSETWLDWLKQEAKT